VISTPHQPAAHRQAKIFWLVEGIEGQRALRPRGVAVGVGQFQAGRDGEKEAGIEGVRDANQVSQVHRLGYAFDTNAKISPHAGGVTDSGLGG
jgi:hypothetical protein